MPKSSSLKHSKMQQNDEISIGIFKKFPPSGRDAVSPSPNDAESLPIEDVNNLPLLVGPVSPPGTIPWLRGWFPLKVLLV